MQRKLWAIAILPIALIFSVRTEAIMVMSFTVEELMARAEKVFIGTCTNVSHRVNDQGIPVTEVTFAVSEAVKGEVGTTVTFQQLDTQAQQRPLRSASQDLLQENPQGFAANAVIANLPNYLPGEEVLLFLAAPGKLGLTAPIGFTQGKLPVTTLTSGEKVITNTAFTKTTAANSTFPDPGKTAQYEQFLKALRALTQPEHQ